MDVTAKASTGPYVVTIIDHALAGNSEHPYYHVKECAGQGISSATSTLDTSLGWQDKQGRRPGCAAVGRHGSRGKAVDDASGEGKVGGGGADVVELCMEEQRRLR